MSTNWMDHRDGQLWVIALSALDRPGLSSPIVTFMNESGAFVARCRPVASIDDFSGDGHAHVTPRSVVFRPLGDRHRCYRAVLQPGQRLRRLSDGELASLLDQARGSRERDQR